MKPIRQSPWPTLYTALPDDDLQASHSEFEKNLPMQETPGHWPRFMSSTQIPSVRAICTVVGGLLVIVVLGILSTAGLVYIIQLSKIPARGSHPCSCGSSVAEALKNNCQFDLLSAAWLPPACIDSELSAEFDVSGPGPNGSWSYFADRNGTQEMRPEDIGALADNPKARYYSTKEWHLIHCFFYWRKQIRSRYTGTIVEPRFDHEGHAKHCVMIFYRDYGLQETATNQGASLDSGEVGAYEHV